VTRPVPTGRGVRRLLGLLVAAAAAGAPLASARAGETGPAPGPARSGARAPVPPPGTWHARQGLRFQRNWGVDIVGVRRVSSGMMLRFDYRVVGAEKASVLTDRKNRPYLIDEATGIALAVPAMEKVGELRQVAPLQYGRTYYIIFGNPGALVKHGARVTVVAGPFRAEGLEVD
jgi:hypothetical protein